MMEKKSLKQQLTQHLIIFVGFILLGFAYAHPVLSGEELLQGDIVQFKGMSHEIKVFRDVEGEEPFWTNSMFSGMPSFNISTKYGYHLPQFLHRNIIGLLPSPVNFMFVLMLGMFILLRAARANIWLSAIGAVAFAFSSNYMISLEAGHNTKVFTMGYSAALLGAVMFAFRGKWVTGGLLSMLFTSLIFVTNHVQIIYYLLLVLVFVAIFYFVEYLREKKLTDFFKISAVLVLTAVIGIMPNVAKLWSIYEHGQNTMRGGASELTYKENKSGLEKDYAFRWSLRPDEVLTTITPYYLGGGDDESLGSGSNVYETGARFFNQDAAEQISQHVPLYFGEQPFTSGPNYFGATIIFLFLLGLLVLKKPMRYWLIPAIILSFILAWGRHLPSVNYFLFETLPLFNKFRTPSMAIHIAGMLFPLLSILGLHHVLRQKNNKDELLKKLKYAAGISLGILVLLLLYSFMRDYSHPDDLQNLARQFGMNPNNQQQGNVLRELVSAIEADRARMFRMDILRSGAFILLTAGVLWAYLKGKLKNANYAMIGIGILLVVDVWAVSKRYFNAEDFRKPSEMEQRVSPQPYDMQILQAEFNQNSEAQQLFQEMQNEARRSEGQLSQEEVNQLKFDALMMTSHYRVFNMAKNTYNDAETSYFHKSIGGYHAAKQQRYQDMIDFHLSGQHIHRPVINMLNTKYIITPGRQNQPQAQPNRNALGNAWFVNNYKMVPSANDEIRMLHRAYEVTDLTGQNGTHVHQSTFMKDTLGSFEELILSTGSNWQESGYSMSLEQLNLRPGDTMIVGTSPQADRQISSGQNGAANVQPEHAMIRLVYVFDPSQDAIVHKEFNDQLQKLENFAPQPGDQITLTDYAPNEMKYQSNTSGERLAVFSEFYYEDGWHAYIDGEPAPHFRVNYILRAMRVPEGEHEITFEFMPRTIKQGNRINLAGSILFILVLLGGLYYWYRKQDPSNEQNTTEV